MTWHADPVGYMGKSPAPNNTFAAPLISRLNNYFFNVEQDIKQTLQTLKNGGTILYPTDTIWGIGCDSTNAEAVKKVYEIKHRNDSKNMIVLLAYPGDLNYYVDAVPDIALQLIEYSDKPLTIVFSGARNLAPNVISPDGTIGIRIVKDPFCVALLNRFKKPIISTSANISGQPSPANFSEISNNIIQAVDYTVTWRQYEKTKAKASSIIKLGPRGEIEIIRK
jgi:L-threonylcarbamoyladenylate synthase